MNAKPLTGEFIGGPWDGLWCPSNHENVFLDPAGQIRIIARAGKQAIGEYRLDPTMHPPVWRWTRRTDDD